MNYTLSEEQLSLMLALAREQGNASARLALAEHNHTWGDQNRRSYDALRQAKTTDRRATECMAKFLDKLHTENV